MKRSHAIVTLGGAIAVLALAACLPNFPAQAATRGGGNSNAAAPAASVNAEVVTQETIVDRWHEYNDGMLTDIGLIRVPPHTEWDSDGRPITYGEGSFGGGRIPLIGHDLYSKKAQHLLAPKDPEAELPEAILIKKSLEEKNLWAAALLFGSRMHPLTEKSVKEVRFSDVINGPRKSWHVLASARAEGLSLAKRTLATGENQTGAVKEFRLHSRVVRLTGDACLKCHVGSKVGDPAGVMVYAVADAKPKEKQDP